MAEARLLRLGKADYKDDGDQPVDGLSPRAISNLIFAPSDDFIDKADVALSDMIWAFAQLMDHDFALNTGWP